MGQGNTRVQRNPVEFVDYITDLSQKTGVPKSTIMREIARIKPIIAEKR